MKGIEIMLMGIYSVVQNNSNESPYEINGDIDMENIKVSEADWHLIKQEKLMPREIKITSWQNMPYSGFKQNEKGKYEGTGYAFELLKLIQRNLDFTYTIVPPEPSMLGDETKGLMKQLYNNEVDLAVAFIPILTSFQQICSYSGVLDEAEITFVMKRPRGSAVGSGLLAPFNDTVWWCILIALIVVGPVIYVILYIRKKVSSRGNPEGYPLSTCIWFTYGALLKQGSNVSPMTDTTRMLFATWWIFITILTSFYTANLTAFLTLSEFTLPITSITDIAKSGRKWVTFTDHIVDNTINLTYIDQLAELRQSLQRRDGQYIESDNHNKSVDFYNVRNIANSDKLFIGEKYFLESLIFDDYRRKTVDRVEELKRCTLVSPEDNIYVNDRAFAYPKNSPIAEHIDRHLRILVETGMVKHLKKESLPSVQYCPLDLKSTERKLGNEDLQMTYYCVVVGFSLSILAFFGELIYRFVQLRAGFSCGKCCDRMCCRTRLQSTELPIYKRDYPSNFYNKASSPIPESPYDGKIAEKSVINGREYWVIREKDGSRRLVPVRAPSALLFQNTSHIDALSSNGNPKF